MRGGTNFIDLTGTKFGRLLVIRRAKNRNKESTCWLCVCDCGEERIVYSQSLRSGYTKSCGCLQRDVARGHRFGLRHGMHGTSEYRSWRSMKMRCLLPTYRQYQHYGGRGIAVCDSWMKFENFFSDMGFKPTPLHSIDRIDNDGDYEPRNCRWATDVEQNRNKRPNTRIRNGNHLLTFKGETMPLIAWAERVGISRITLGSRLKHGWSAERALSEPVSRSR